MLTTVGWIEIIVLGGLAGAVGQAARSIVGIKKVNDLAAAENLDPKTLFAASRLFVSLVIGFVAGALAALFMEIDTKSIELLEVLGMAAAGYTGADFVEGMINRVKTQPATDAANELDKSNTATTKDAVDQFALSEPEPQENEYQG